MRWVVENGKSSLVAVLTRQENTEKQSLTLSACSLPGSPAHVASAEDNERLFRHFLNPFVMSLV